MGGSGVREDGSHALLLSDQDPNESVVMYRPFATPCATPISTLYCPSYHILFIIVGRFIGQVCGLFDTSRHAIMCRGDD